MHERRPGLIPLSAAQRALCESALELVHRCARVVARCTPATAEDLESVGNEALVRCAVRFDPSLGIPFAGFAWVRVRGAMLKSVYGGARVPERLQKLLGGGVENDPEPESTDATVTAADACVERARGRLAMMLLVLGEGRDEGDRFEHAEWDAFVRSTMARLLSQLTAEERTLVNAIYVTSLTIDETAAQLNINRAMVRRTHDKVKARLLAGLTLAGIQHAEG